MSTSVWVLSYSLVGNTKLTDTGVPFKSSQATSPSLQRASTAITLFGEEPKKYRIDEVVSMLDDYSGQSSAPNEDDDPVLQMWGVGKQIWKEEDGDAFIARERGALESIHFVSSLDRAPV
jgi:hypothetical protein